MDKLHSVVSMDECTCNLFLPSMQFPGAQKTLGEQIFGSYLMSSLRDSIGVCHILKEDCPDLFLFTSMELSTIYNHSRIATPLFVHKASRR